MSPRRILAIDVGNTRTKAGLFDCGGTPRLVSTNETPALWTVSRDAAFPWSDVHRSLEATPRDSARAVISGSDPGEIARLVNVWPADIAVQTPSVLQSFQQLPLKVDVDLPEKVGLDRLLGAVAANSLRNQNRPAIVVDCGTATTVNVVNSAGGFAGGAILPGLQLSAQALHDRTALLPFVDVDLSSGAIPPVLGKDTHAAIRSGLFWGQVGAVRELVQRFSGEQSPAEVLVLLTGGGAAPLTAALGFGQFHDHLVLLGLALAAQHLAGGHA